eukprot:CAMPEP_0206499074 /NCGR_PEP_ID=MMETSP0324_2-20121206/51473_1 /ASSEMBLY_ACC=CAM_ASM_000836 /TAXON_ID=2866 /ORGANISM="Crypthecodinium cohnii, Strain Seligo" /LENGTH=435 /DNA_ID=CAMNT_0053985583 /DNA_START=10 /DNA_END=1316 /DNA_ORIENTATION=+
MTRCNGDVVGTYAALVSGPVFFVTLFFCRDLQDGFGIASQDVFFDRACIRQAKHVCETPGHADTSTGDFHLATLLKHSDQLLVVYSSVYLRKLWTVYEVAAFTMQRKDATKHMKVLPVSLITVVLVQFALCYLWAAVVVLLMEFGAVMDNRLVAPVLAALEAAYLFAIRTWQREKRNMKDSILHFKVRECLCSVVDDRQLVYSNIRALLRGVELILPAATLDEALDTFDALMQTRFRHAFGSAFSRCALEYRHYIFLGFLMWGSIGFDQIAGIALNPDPRSSIAGVNAASSMIPLIFIFQEYMMSCKLDWTGAAEMCWVAISFLMVWAPVHVYHQGLYYLEDLSTTSDFGLAAISAIGGISTIVGFLLLCKRPGSCAESDGCTNDQVQVSFSETAQVRDLPPRDIDESISVSNSISCEGSQPCDNSYEEHSEFSL